MQPFDLKNIYDQNVCIIGKRASGKTTVVRDILYRLDIPTAVLYGHEFLEEYQDVPGIRFIKKWDPKIIDVLVAEQRSKDAQHVVIVLENILEKEYDTDKIIDLIMNSRMYKIMIIACIQHPMVIKPYIRHGFNCLFMLNENNHDMKHKLYYYCNGAFQTFSSFDKAITDATADYGCLVIYESIPYFFKADLHKKK